MKQTKKSNILLTCFPVRGRVSIFVPLTTGAFSEFTAPLAVVLPLPKAMTTLHKIVRNKNTKPIVKIENNHISLGTCIYIVKTNMYLPIVNTAQNTHTKRSRPNADFFNSICLGSAGRY